MTAPQDVIAWLVPTARGSSADKATNMCENSHHTIKSTTSAYLTTRLPNLLSGRPQNVIQLSFDQAPKRPGSFVLGTDVNSCDIVLPKLPGISPMHCALGFDGESRLVLDDFSEQGTQVWYDWECNGDQTDYSWILSSGYSHGFPSTVQRITIDIQGVRFQIVTNNHSEDWDSYKDRVDAFCAQSSWVDDIGAGWDSDSFSPMTSLLSSAPLFQHIIVKNMGPEPVGEVYLWNLAKPWEPMVRASA